MNEPGNDSSRCLISVRGPRRPLAVVVDAGIAAEEAGRCWRWIGGRVIAIGEGDDFTAMTDLAELAAGTTSARPSHPRSLDYRACALNVAGWSREEGVE